MTLVSHSIRKVLDIVGRALRRPAAVIIGLTMTAIGVGMMASVVLLPVGVALGLLGVAIVLAGVFAPDFWNNPQGER
jgi:hypothetical protein